MTTILGITGLTKRYGALAAIDNVDLEVRRSEFVALLGPSGCGKSTFLMTIAGFVQPTSGKITLGGRDVTHEPPEKRGMGVVFQDYALFPHMTAFENVAYPLKLRGLELTERDARTRHALEQVELPARLFGNKPSELSGGQRQRVAVARAVVYDPVILLMDEPLAALDRTLRSHMQFELRHLQERVRTTVLYVTHDQEEALALADRVAIMRHGRFEQVGSPRSLYQCPVNAFVARFLGESNTLAVQDGSQRMLVVRPEAIAIRPRSSPSGLKATIRDVVFLGSRIRVEAALEDGTVWTVNLTPSTHGDTLEPQIGDTVKLTWPDAAASFLERE